jgi:hypothetical protein
VADVKKKSVRAAEQDGPDVQEARRNWPRVVAGRRPRRLIFLTETHFTTAMTRLKGYGPRGRRLVGAAAYSHWKVTTFLRGLTGRGFVAPLVVDVAMDSAVFSAYVEQVLAKEARPGDLVIPYNLAVHKTAAARAAFDRCGIDCPFMPLYSPDLNPIEKAYSKF